MEKRAEKVENTQGVETTKKKKQGISKTYTLTQLTEMTNKLVELGWIDEKEEKELRRIKEKCKAEYIKSL